MATIGPRIGSGRVAEVFEYGEGVLKLYAGPEGRSPAFIEAAILSVVADHDLPTPRAETAGRFEGRWGIAMDRAPGLPLARSVLDQPELVPQAVEEMVRLHRRIHECMEARLPSLKARLANRIGRAPGLEDGDREKLLAGLAAMPDGNRLCHGDFHPFNIMGLPGQTMIIDWLDASSGPPAADVCRTFLLLFPTVPELAENYLDRYVAESGADRQAILAWLPYVAAARLAEEVEGEAEMLLRLARG